MENLNGKRKWKTWMELLMDENLIDFEEAKIRISWKF